MNMNHLLSIICLIEFNLLGSDLGGRCLGSPPRGGFFYNTLAHNRVVGLLTLMIIEEAALYHKHLDEQNRHSNSSGESVAVELLGLKLCSDA